MFVHPTHIQHMPNMSQQHQQPQPPPPPHINMSSAPQQINYMPNQPQKSQTSLPQQPHMMPHNQQNYRSGSQHSHHSQQRMNYGQNRPNFHNGNHNVHNSHSGNNVANVVTPQNSGKTSATAPPIQQQYQFNNVPYNNYKHTYGQQQTDKMNQITPPQQAPDPSKNPIDTQQQQQQQQSIKIASMQMAQKQNNQEVHTMNNDNNAAKLIIELSHGCIDEQNNNTNANATTLTNKTKTPMCLINELVRSNQLKHQYRVTDESGPSHEKTYTVVLELGDERYTAQHKTIKGAQHLAAANALQKTNYKQPVSRSARGILSKHSREKYGATNTITPTVQLNALAMKRGMPTNYSFQYPKSYNDQPLTNYSGNGRNPRRNDPKGNKIRQRDKFSNINNNNNNINNNNNNRNQHSHKTTEDDPYKVTVTIGDKQFTGTGLTLQSAKHDAASKALLEIKEEPNKLPSSTASNESIEQATETIMDSNGDLTSENNVDRLKSAISIVQEIAQKRDLPIRFVVESETGPAHMKHFIIKCSVGEIETTGDGNSKKVAKKHAAENMLNELKKLPPLRPVNDFHGNNGRRNTRLTKRSTSTNGRQQVPPVSLRRKLVSVVKEITPTVISSESTVEDNDLNNPVSRLLRLQQSTKKHDPIYSVVEERGQHRRKEFVMEVNCSGLTARGIGNSKKLAKRIAAKNMLVQLGYSESTENSESSGTDQSAPSSAEKVRKVTFSEPKILNDEVKSVGGSAGRQLVPGLLLMKSPESNKKTKNSDQSSINPATATVAKKLLDSSTSSAPEVSVKQISPVKMDSASSEVSSTVISEDASPSKSEPNNNNVGETKSSSQSQSGVRAADKLLYLAKLFKFEVEFSSFPKGGHNDYLTLISLNSDIAHYFHGSGNSVEAATEQAALSALKTLSEIGLENVNKSRDEPVKSILTNGKN